MHELKATKDMIALLERICMEKNIKAPAIISAEIGELTTYRAETIKHYFDILKKESPVLEGTKLDITEVKAMVLCRMCGKKNEIEPNVMLCPHCGAPDIEVLSGEDFNIKNIKVD